MMETDCPVIESSSFFVYLTLLWMELSLFAYPFFIL
jgi:hypothetical protein